VYKASCVPCKGFNITWDNNDLLEIIRGFPSGKLDHNTRLIEAETAYELGIRFDEEWYNIPVVSREYMIATRLAKRWLDIMNTEESIKNARS